MAEIMLLILFTVLLALAATLADREKQIKELAFLKAAVTQLAQQDKNQITVTDIIQRIQRSEEEAAALRKEVDRLKPYEAVGKAIEDITKAIRATGDATATPTEIASKLRQFQDLLKDNGTLRGQVAQLTGQIRAAGRGNEYPSCWVTATGKEQSIFELVLTTAGIAVKDRNLPDRAADKAALPIKQLVYDREVPVVTFLDQMRPLYSWSIEHNCRFYVILYSTVPSAPIQSVNAVNGYFYPDSKILMRSGVQ
jgi:hypothetical protein